MASLSHRVGTPMGAASTMRVRALEKLAVACYRRVGGRHAGGRPQDEGAL